MQIIKVFSVSTTFMKRISESGEDFVFNYTSRIGSTVKIPQGNPGRHLLGSKNIPMHAAVNVTPRAPGEQQRWEGLFLKFLF
jgi:hypothetical protein